MHSKDQGKQKGKLFADFWHEVNTTLEAVGNGKAYFEEFVFPKVKLRDKTISALCRFESAIFTQDADFRGSTFQQEVDFSRAIFIQSARFSKATFEGDVLFYRTNFGENAEFSDAIFKREARFPFATFGQEVDFNKADIVLEANFTKSIFNQTADFSELKFRLGADFSFATFSQTVHFIDTIFSEKAIFRGSSFLGTANFRRTKFSVQAAPKPSAVFALASFARPSEIVFDNVNVSQVLFQNCDVSQLWFTSSVKWAGTAKRNSMVFEETIPLGQEDSEQLQVEGARDYRAVAQIYQQLKKNYDSRLDYWTANEFHFGEMEMQRLVPTKGNCLKLRAWWQRNLSFVALYRWGSDYGNSYLKPIVWLFLLLVTFALLYPLPNVGLQRNGTGYTETYESVWQGASAGHRFPQESKLLGDSLLAAVETATFQKNTEFIPAYPLGRVLAVLEILLTSTLFALFLLAIRRQFRR